MNAASINTTLLIYIFLGVISIIVLLLVFLGNDPQIKK